MLLSFVGFAAVGTLFAAAVCSTRLQGGLLAMVIFPICLPLVITSTQTLLHVFRDNEPIGGMGLAILVAFDVIYLVRLLILLGALRWLGRRMELVELRDDQGELVKA